MTYSCNNQCRKGDYRLGAGGGVYNKGYKYCVCCEIFVKSNPCHCCHQRTREKPAKSRYRREIVEYRRTHQ